MNKQLKIWAAAGMMALFMGTAAAAPQAILPKAAITAESANNQVTIGKVTYQLDTASKTAMIIRIDSTLSTLSTANTIKYNGVTYTVNAIKEKACYQHSNLENLTVNSNIKTIESSAFASCSKLQSVEFMGNPEFGQWDRSIFSNCPSLNSVKLNDSMIKIPSGMFEDCTALTQIILPTSLQTIGGGAFENCTSLNSINFPAGLTEIKSSAFRNCTAFSGTAVIPAKVSNIGEDCFRNSGWSYVWSNGAATIGKHAFMEMPNLNKVTLTGEETLCNGAFYHNQKLVNLEIPTSSTGKWEYNAFDYCMNLQQINGGAPTWSYNKNKDDVLFDGAGMDSFVKTHFNASTQVGFVEKYCDDYCDIIVKQKVTNSMTDIQIAKTLHDWIIKKMNPPVSGASGPHCYIENSIFLNNTSLCQGYSKGYMKLMNKAGIPTKWQETAGKHMWAVSKIGGVWFKTDVLWDENGNSTPDDEWFMQTDKEFLEKESVFHANATGSPNAVYPMGDVNMDKVITDADITLLNKYLAKSASLNANQLVLADLNFDGKITSADTTKLTAKLKKRFDLNGDGLMNHRDYGLLHMYLVKQITFSNEMIYKADNNNDGVVNYKDLSDMKNYLKNYCGISTLYRMGDVNTDGKLTQADVTKLTAYLTTSGSLNSIQGSLADINNDGVVNAADLSKLKALLKYQIGDVNRDGKINSTDITLIKNHISKKAILSDAVLWYADVNGDGSIDISDYMKLGNDYNIPY